MKRLQKGLLLGVMMVALVAFAQPARALTISLNLGNPGISGFTGPYANVGVSLIDSTHAQITFTALGNATNLYLFGGQGAMGLNVNATSFSVQNGNAGFTGDRFGVSTNTGQNNTTIPGPFSTAGAGNEDGFGSFNFTVDSFDGFTHAATTASFVLVNGSGTWASDANVLTANGSNGYVAAAHIFVANNDANKTNTNATGYATNGPSGTPRDVPDGGLSLSLLGMALGAMGVVSRRLS